MDRGEETGYTLLSLRADSELKAKRKRGNLGPQDRSNDIKLRDQFVPGVKLRFTPGFGLRSIYEMGFN